MNYVELIERNNEEHNIGKKELAGILEKADEVYKSNFPSTTWFERSIFINWTCAIADCKYCYLSTMPKLDRKAVRSMESVLAESLICKKMGWKIGYITGGLRVEPTKYIIGLMENMRKITKEKVAMNFGPYSEREILEFKPYISGMGSAIESFDEKLHDFICPSKPLKSLLKSLEILKREEIPSFITIILGMGEREEDVNAVIEQIKKWSISKVQLCFLKPQEDTMFFKSKAPSAEYMAWWISNIRIACPKICIKVALVRERIKDLPLMLKAGCNSFTRFLVFNDFCTPLANELEDACKAAGRRLEGNFTKLPEIDIDSALMESELPNELKEKVRQKAIQYYEKLRKLSKRADYLCLNSQEFE
ncbi:radical SAM protein [Candidatus Woesearchaeota archaeon]|nr:radical SAM protein [Candidatus Woesearchaeota archaeon]